MRRALPLLRRLLVMVGGEAMQSAFHFALNILLMHRLSAENYGLFALAMVISGVAISYVRSLTAVPASIWIGRQNGRHRAHAYDVSFASGAFVLSVGISLLTVLLMVAWKATEILSVGVFVLFWSFRSHLRTSNFALGRPGLVALSDLGFTLSSVAAIALVIWRGGDLLHETFLAMAATNALGVAVMLFGMRRPIRFTLRASMRRRWLGLWRSVRWSAVSATTTTLQGQAMALLVASFAGPAAYAPIAAVLVFFTPLRIVATAIANMVQPEIARLVGRDDAAIRRLMGLWTLGLGLVGLCYGAFVLAALPYLKSDVLAGTDGWLIGLFSWAIFFTMMLYVMPRITLEAFGDFGTVATTTGVAALFGVGAIVLLLFLAPPDWVLAGAAASEVLVAILSWVAIGRRLAPREAGSLSPRLFSGRSNG
ncbi:hypothetical protein M673_19255 (plasmid) [Aureimonas sp. AU20]|uniref:hypothetical protein n=1 Tax=Aureimonas sp. AU20 TaxID=1349819 RepID=UPI000720AE43|nr:hypothetical protein [Aureimonas sp. AU20]ALN74866.1 hypothetical protein M673_19255 [Aureimonas sp. AU20]